MLLIKENIIIKSLIMKVFNYKKKYFTLSYTLLLFRFFYLALSTPSISILLILFRALSIAVFNLILNFDIINFDFLRGL